MVSAQALGGLAGAAAGSVIGAGVGWGLGLALADDCDTAEDPSDLAACVAIAILPFLGASAGALAGVPVGVATAGEVMDRPGSGWGAVAGGLAGGALAAGLTSLVQGEDDGVGPIEPGALQALAVAALGGSLAGSVAGYHLLAPGEEPEARPTAPADVVAEEEDPLDEPGLGGGGFVLSVLRGTF